jgi:hypothetical protein
MNQRKSAAPQRRAARRGRQPARPEGTGGGPSLGWWGRRGSGVNVEDLAPVHRLPASLQHAQRRHRADAGLLAVGCSYSVRFLRRRAAEVSGVALYSSRPAPSGCSAAPRENFARRSARNEIASGPIRRPGTGLRDRRSTPGASTTPRAAVGIIFGFRGRGSSATVRRIVSVCGH